MSKIHSNLIVSAAPHINAKTDTASIMRDVIIALLPAVCFAGWLYGIRPLVLSIFCVTCCIVMEWACRRILNRPQTIGDLSAAVTGLILAMSLPTYIPYWMAAIGCFTAIIIVKQLFGGLGQNFANPAAVARIVLAVGFSEQMTSWIMTGKMSQAILNAAGADAVTGATPLILASKGLETPSLIEMFIGNVNGAMGETSVLFLLVGGAYLVIKKIINPIIPLSFLGSAAIISLVAGLDPLYQLCAGGMIFGAIFMAGDYVTTPSTGTGKLIFGIGCGAITMLIRMFSNYSEGVSFAILLMNIITPYIDTWTKRPSFGNEGRRG